MRSQFMSWKTQLLPSGKSFIDQRPVRYLSDTEKLVGGGPRRVTMHRRGAISTGASISPISGRDRGSRPGDWRAVGLLLRLLQVVSRISHRLVNFKPIVEMIYIRWYNADTRSAREQPPSQSATEARGTLMATQGPYGPIPSHHDVRDVHEGEAGYFGYHPLPSWWTRVGAGLIDYGPPWLVQHLAGLYLPSAIANLITLVSLAVVIFNSGYLAGTTGRSIGKRLTHLYVGKYQGSGEPPGAAWGIVRILLHALDGIFFLGFLWAIWSPYKQTWADILTGTVVVRQTWVEDRPGRWPIFKGDPRFGKNGPTPPGV